MRMRWTIGIVLLAPSLLGCGEGTTAPVAGMQIADVAEVYEVCTMAFIPEGAQPSVDLRTNAFETANPSVSRPQLRINPTGELQLAYTPRGEFVQQDIRGTARVLGNRIVLDFDQRGTRAPSTILLPNPLMLDFAPSPLTLSTSASSSYLVGRTTYAHLAGISEAGLADQIPGSLSATFRVGSCE